MTQQDNLEQEAKRLGEYIALLLNAADIPEKDKIAFANLLPSMEPEQIDRLVKILEANIKDNSQEIPGLKEKVEAIEQKYKQQEEAITNHTLKALEEIEQKLKSEE